MKPNLYNVAFNKLTTYCTVKYFIARYFQITSRHFLKFKHGFVHGLLCNLKTHTKQTCMTTFLS